MTYLRTITAAQDDAARTDHEGFMAAYTTAAERASCSCFDQHIVRDDDGRYWVADEGDYEPLMQELVDRIVHTVPARRNDEY